MRFRAAVGALLLSTLGPGHVLGGWHDRVEALDGALTPRLAAEKQEIVEATIERLSFVEVNGPYLAPEEARTRPRAAAVDFSPRVERWRPLVEYYFHAEDVEWALRVMRCESRGDPNAANPRSSARGLFQHLKRLWPERAVSAGWPGADILDPEANIAVAAWLLYEGGPSHWVCR